MRRPDSVKSTDGIRAILVGSASIVPLAPGMELYNAAPWRRWCGSPWR